MPPWFGTLDEARTYQELIMRRTFHLVGETYVRIMSAKNESGHPQTADTPGELIDPCHVPNMLLGDRDAYLEDIRRWCGAFRPIFRKLVASRDPTTSIRAASLKIQILGAKMCLAGAFFTEECEFDIFLPEAQEIISLARLIPKRTEQLYPQVLPVLNYSQGIEQPLHDVATMCREKELRFEAISILRSLGQRDPTHHVARTVARAEYVVTLEEAGRNAIGKVPESARFRRIWVLTHHNEPSRNLTVVYARRIGYPLGRDYPAKREWRCRTFSQEEADSMIFEPKPMFQPWPERLAKPLAFKWAEVHGELLQLRSGRDA
jgi:hypothetical protein